MENTKKTDCLCPKTKCENHNKCDDCRAKHYKKKGLPYCERKKED